MYVEGMKIQEHDTCVFFVIIHSFKQIPLILYK